MASEEEFSYPSDNEITQVQYHPRKSDASPRPQSARKKGKSPRSSRPGSSAKGTPYGSFGKLTSSGRKSATGLSKTSAGSKTGSKKELFGHKSPQEYYTDTLRKTGVGFSDSAKHQSFSGLSKTQADTMSFSSTSHYLRQKVGAEKKSVRTRPSSAGRPAGGGPAYKSQEEYYDDIIELKKQIQAMSKDNSVMKSRVRRLEEDNTKKEKEIEQLLDPGKSEEMRRTLADRKPDAGTVIHSMKQKNLKLEQQLKEKEAAYNKLQSDLKTTKVEELKIQMEAFYNEVLRLQKVKSLDSPTFRNAGQSSRDVKESPAKMKALQDTIKKMNEQNYKLKVENKQLKDDLERQLDEAEKRKANNEKYSDMNKKELMSTISKLEKRLDKAEETTSLMSDVDSRSGNIEGKIKLEGTAAQRIDQLDRRETELLEELSKSRKTCQKVKEDRVHYRKKVEEKEKEIKSLKRELEEVQAELDGFYDKDKSRVTPRSATPPRRESRVVAKGSYDKRKVEEFRKKHAAKTIQTRWRSHRQEKEEREDEEAAEMIQSYLRAHQSRKTHLKRGRNSRRDYVDDDSASLDQSESDSNALTDLYAKQLDNRNSRSNSLRLGSLKSRGSRVSDDETEQTETDSDMPITGSLNKRSSGRFTSISSSGRASPGRSKSPFGGYSKRSNDISEDEDSEDDDDDLIVTSSRR